MDLYSEGDDIDLDVRKGISMDITGRKLFVKALEEEGVSTIFGYPGGTVTDLFDELYKQDNIKVVLPRHEQGLIHEAEGDRKSVV